MLLWSEGPAETTPEKKGSFWLVFSGGGFIPTRRAWWPGSVCGEGVETAHNMADQKSENSKNSGPGYNLQWPSPSGLLPQSPSLRGSRMPKYSHLLQNKSVRDNTEQNLTRMFTNWTCYTF